MKNDCEMRAYAVPGRPIQDSPLLAAAKFFVAKAPTLDGANHRELRKYIKGQAAPESPAPIMVSLPNDSMFVRFRWASDETLESEFSIRLGGRIFAIRIYNAFRMIERMPDSYQGVITEAHKRASHELLHAICESQSKY